MSKRKLLTVILLAFVTTLMLTCAVIFTACRNNETPDDGHNTEQGGENPGGDDAPTEYTITFVADGAVVGTYTYTETDKTISEPSVPVREGYMGIWEDYTLTTGNITVNAICGRSVRAVPSIYDMGIPCDRCHLEHCDGRVFCNRA